VPYTVERIQEVPVNVDIHVTVEKIEEVPVWREIIEPVFTLTNFLERVHCGENRRNPQEHLCG